MTCARSPVDELVWFPVDIIDARVGNDSASKETTNKKRTNTSTPKTQTYLSPLVY